MGCTGHPETYMRIYRGGGELADTLVGQGSIVLAAKVVMCERGAGSDFWVRSVREVVGVFEPAVVIFGRFAKRVVAA